MTTRKRLCSIKGISEAKVDKIKVMMLAMLLCIAVGLRSYTVDKYSLFCCRKPQAN